MNTNHDKSLCFSSYLLYKAEKPSVCLHYFSSHWSLHQLTLDVHEAKAPKLWPMGYLSSFPKALGAVFFPQVLKAQPYQLNCPSLSVALNNKLPVDLL